MKKIIILAISLFLLMSFSIHYQPKPYTFPILNLFPKMPLADNNQVTEKGVSLGRYLFYDTILSLNYDMSCGSCHKQEAAFSDAPKQFSIGNNGTLSSRNALPLFNLAWYPAFFWDGRAGTLEGQVFHPVRDTNEMNLDWNIALKRLNANKFYKKQFGLAFGTSKIDSVLVTKAIGQFLRTLISYQSKFDRVIAGKDHLNNDEYDGMVLMNDMTKGDCLHCHLTDGDALTTMTNFSNNGLDRIENFIDFKDKGRGGVTQNPRDNGKFKTPSLRNVALTAPYMHDGRFATLEEVLDFYSEGVQISVTIDAKMGAAHKGGVHLSKEEKRKIIAFLHTLTDSVFVSNEAFSNPFHK